MFLTDTFLVPTTFYNKYSPKFKHSTRPNTATSCFVVKDFVV